VLQNVETVIGKNDLMLHIHGCQ